MRNRFVSGVITGAVMLCLCQFLAEWWGGMLANVASGDPPKWHIALALGLSSVASVLPGLCAGFISGGRGFVVGATAGVLGSFLYGVLQFSMLLHAGSFSLNAHTWPVMFIFPSIYSIGLVVTSSVGGGAGQLLRSNNRFERSRV